MLSFFVDDEGPPTILLNECSSCFRADEMNYVTFRTDIHESWHPRVRLELDFDVLDQDRDSDNVDDHKGSDATVIPALMRLREDQKRRPFFS